MSVVDSAKRLFVSDNNGLSITVEEQNPRKTSQSHLLKGFVLECIDSYFFCPLT